MILSIDADKAFDKIQHHFLIKNLQSIGIEETFLNFIKTVYEKAHSEYHSQWGKAERFSLKIRNLTGIPTLTTVVQHSARSPSLSH